MMRWIFRLDLLVLAPALFLCFLSYLFLSSYDSALAQSHLRSIFIGVLFFFVGSSIAAPRGEKYLMGIFYISLLVLALLFVFGDTRSGATRWLSLGNFGFQPSEFVKVIFLLYLSALFGHRSVYDWLFYVYVFMVTAAIFGAVALQPDLDNAITFVMVFMLFLFYATRSMRRVGIIIALILMVVFVTSPLVWQNLRGYQRERILTFMQPARDPLGAGYHASQALITVGSGQVWGRGLGNGTQFRNSFLPEHTTDFAFASFSEEFGFMGSLLIIILYMIMLSRLIYRLVYAKSRYYQFLLLGVSVFLFMHTCANIGMNLGLLPVMGITLPFFSFGGSSIMSFFMMLGLVQSEKSALIGRTIVALED